MELLHWGPLAQVITKGGTTVNQEIMPAYAAYQKAIDLMASGVVNIEDFVSETMPLDDFEKGISMVRMRPRGFVKAEFQP